MGPFFVPNFGNDLIVQLKSIFTVYRLTHSNISRRRTWGPAADYYFAVSLGSAPWNLPLDAGLDPSAFCARARNHTHPHTRVRNYTQHAHKHTAITPNTHTSTHALTQACTHTDSQAYTHAHSLSHSTARTCTDTTQTSAKVVAHLNRVAPILPALQ